MIYRALLDADFDKLPPLLRDFHASPGLHRAAGTGMVRHQNPLLAWLVGFPPAGEVQLQLEVRSTEDEETWTRWFGDARRSSTQRAQSGLLMETAGPVRIAFQLRASESGMQFESCGARFCGIPVPLRIAASTRCRDGAWEVDVTIAHIGSYHAVMRMKP